MSDHTAPAALKTTATAILADDAAVAGLVDDVINAIALAIQTKIGSTDGGIAGVHFSDDVERALVENVTRRYLKVEAAGEDADDEQPDCVATGKHMDDGRGMCRFGCGMASPFPAGAV